MGANVQIYLFIVTLNQPCTDPLYMFDYIMLVHQSDMDSTAACYADTQGGWLRR